MRIDSKHKTTAHKAPEQVIKKAGNNPDLKQAAHDENLQHDLREKIVDALKGMNDTYKRFLSSY